MWYTFFVVMFTLTLSVFMLGDTYTFTSKIRERVLGDEKRGQKEFFEIVEHDEVWDYLANRFAPSVYPVSRGTTRDPTSILLGAVQLRQTRVATSERCVVSGSSLWRMWSSPPYGIG